MRRTVRIMTYYMIIYVMFAVGQPMFLSVAGNRGFSREVSVMTLVLLPYVALGTLILDAKRLKFRRTALWVCAVLALLPYPGVLVFGDFFWGDSHSVDATRYVGILLFLPVTLLFIQVIVTAIKQTGIEIQRTCWFKFAGNFVNFRY